ncbi:hypothetical protein C8R44DRAFT_404480 [Mycena epipterygia]|nr:hypothetical protein C8R44DRAFT_404480 [Mycena epipterygia]
MSRSITVEYRLNPPASSGQSCELPTSKKHDFEVDGSPNDGQSEHYKKLRETIARARQEVGQELTAWRDAVGKAELSKETKKPTNDEEEEEEDGDDA